MRRSIRVFSAALSVLAIVAGAASIAHAAACRPVQGFLVETPLPASSCGSPVGLCTVGQIFGAVKGEALFTASAVIPSLDTAVTGVVFVVGDTVINNVQLGNYRGTVVTKNAAAFRVGGGDIVDIQTVLGGTGDFAGVTGSLQVHGTFDPDTGGTSTFEGVVCIP